MTKKLDSRCAVYAGSFDPITLGHLDIICRGAQVFERLIVGIGINPEKHPLFSPEERMVLAREVVAPIKNAEVTLFEGLAVDFVRSCGAAVILRGVRTLTDIEAEFSMTLANRMLAPEIETVFLMASENYTHVSSSLIKQIASMGQISGASQKLKDFLPQPVIEPLLSKCRPPSAARDS